MDKCGHLTGARNLYAWFDSERKQVTISADVEINPFSTQAEICPNPLARITPPPEAREFLVEAITIRSGIVPLPVMVKRIYYSFHSDATPAKVRVYTMGIDNPAANDVPVKDRPPAPLTVGAPTSAAASTTTAAAVAKRERVEGHGWSESFSFEEALHNAVADLQSKIPPLSHNPDVGIAAEVVKTIAHVGGNIRPGLEIVVRG
jgi:hypothetical protein